MAGLFFERDDMAIWSEFADAIPFWITDTIGEDSCSLGGFGSATKQSAKVVTEEYIVTENQGAVIFSDKVRTDDESLSQSAGVTLNGIVEVYSPFASVAEQTSEARSISWCRNDQDVAYTAKHQGGQRIVDQGLVIDRQQLL